MMLGQNFDDEDDEEDEEVDSPTMPLFVARAPVSIGTTWQAEDAMRMGGA